jgi:hypothetical protein
MVKINKIVETTARLMINGDIVGEFNSILQLNDIRIQIKNKYKDIRYDSNDRYTGYSIIWNDVEIFIFKNGNLSEWPKGFFEIIDEQLMELAYW